MDDKEKNDRALEKMKDACAALGAHFDTVQILATKHSSQTGTFRTAWGIGNSYARYGQVKDWLIREEAYAREEERLRAEGRDDA